VVDLESKAEYKVFDLPAADGRPDRIVLDVFRPAGERPRTVAPAVPRQAVQPYTVVIDPGHGGLDPGAIRSGLREKDVVLDVCLQMSRLLEKLPGYRAVLTRQKDYYPSLTRRVEIARKAGGDLFLSIHCNTHRRRSVRGMEIYFLSLQGATDREAQELADKENAADLVGLAPEEADDDLVVSILMDLRMTQVMHQSSRLAEYVLASARTSETVDARRVKQARFQVLRNLAMPSALIELAYLSNPEDHRLLSSKKGRKKLAELLVESVLRYRHDESALALLDFRGGWTQRYRVRRGDSLWKLAKRYGTTVAEISQRNNLSSAGLKIGQTLMLPEAD
jgi:N-acetylmuramoyl-L-alanine amidase